jgi:hypothetical protein
LGKTFGLEELTDAVETKFRAVIQVEFEVAGSGADGDAVDAPY